MITQLFTPTGFKNATDIKEIQEIEGKIQANKEEIERLKKKKRTCTCTII